MVSEIIYEKDIVFPQALFLDRAQLLTLLVLNDSTC